MEMKYYIYVLRDDNDNVLYFGKTKQAEDRLGQHRTEIKVSPHSPKYQFLARTPFTLHILAWTSDSALATRIEKHLVATYSLPILNTKGRGSLPIIHTDEWKDWQKRRESIYGPSEYEVRYSPLTGRGKTI